MAQETRPEAVQGVINHLREIIDEMTEQVQVLEAEFVQRCEARLVKAKQIVKADQFARNKVIFTAGATNRLPGGAIVAVNEFLGI